MEPAALRIPLTIPTNAKDVALVTSEKPFSRHNIPDRRHRLLFVREGTLCVQLASAAYEVGQDQALIIEAGNAFVRTHTQAAPLRYYALRFLIETPPPASALAASPATILDLPTLSTLARPDLVEQLFRLMLNEQNEGAIETRLSQLIFVQILAEVADAGTRRSASAKPCIPVVERAKGHIRAYYDSQISTATIAKSVDCSPGYLSRAFQKATGSTVTAFIHEVRLFRAKVLLTETNRSVANIAHECGFDNPSYFHRLFHRHEGVSPGDYRRLHSGIYTVSIE